MAKRVENEHRYISGIAELDGKRITKTEEINIVHQIFDELNKRNK